MPFEPHNYCCHMVQHFMAPKLLMSTKLAATKPWENSRKEAIHSDDLSPCFGRWWSQCDDCTLYTTLTGDPKGAFVVKAAAELTEQFVSEKRSCPNREINGIFCLCSALPGWVCWQPWQTTFSRNRSIFGLAGLPRHVEWQDDMTNNDRTTTNGPIFQRNTKQLSAQLRHGCLQRAWYWCDERGGPREPTCGSCHMIFVRCLFNNLFNVQSFWWTMKTWLHLRSFFWSPKDRWSLTRLPAKSRGPQAKAITAEADTFAPKISMPHLSRGKKQKFLTRKMRSLNGWV